MAKHIDVHAYLAGPDVFFPRAKEIGEEKKAKLAAVGITAHFPFDNELPKDTLGKPDLAARAIARANEKFIADCCRNGRIGIILANMAPYHGPSMDVGTAFEIGFMSALAEIYSNVIIIGYTDDPRTFEERVIADYYRGHKNIQKNKGLLVGPDGNAIEAFGKADNLMITSAIEKTGGQIVRSFDEAVKLAKKLSAERIQTLHQTEQLPEFFRA